MTVITISRENFALGTSIAQSVANEMGYHLITKDTFEKILRQYGLVQLDKLLKSSNFWAIADASNQELISLLNKTILGFAQLDNMVILGRGGFAVLQEYANVLNVRIQAPFGVRAQRLMNSEDLDESTAKQMITENDKSRVDFVKGFYDVNPYNTKFFQLVLDTGVLSVETASRWIVETARILEGRSISGEPTTRNVAVEPILADAIQQVLEAGRA